MHARCPQRSDEDTGLSGTGDMDGGEQLCRCWGSDPDPGPLPEQKVLLTAGRTLQPCIEDL